MMCLAAASALAGCSSYHPWRAGGGGGYSETRLDRDRSQVRFALPAYVGQPPDSYRRPDGTSYQQMVDFTLRRAAELCLAAGCAYFVIERQNEDTKKERRGLGVAGRPPTLIDRAETVVEPAFTLVVRFHSKKPADPGAIDAAGLLEKLQREYRWP